VLGAKFAFWHGETRLRGVREGSTLQSRMWKRLKDSMVFFYGNGPEQDSSDQTRIRNIWDAARSSRSIGGFWQHTPGGGGSD